MRVWQLWLKLLTSVWKQHSHSDFIGAKDNGGSGYSWNCKAPIVTTNKPTPNFFTGRSPNQQCQRTEGRLLDIIAVNYLDLIIKHVTVFNIFGNFNILEILFACVHYDAAVSALKLMTIRNGMVYFES